MEVIFSLSASFLRLSSSGRLFAALESSLVGTSASGEFAKFHSGAN